MIINFEEYNKREKEFKDYKKQIILIIDDFILNTDFIKNHNSKIGDPRLSSYRNAENFFKSSRRTLVVDYSNKNSAFGGRIEFTKEEEKRLKDFMKNPELYKDSQKYNL